MRVHILWYHPHKCWSHVTPYTLVSVLYYHKISVELRVWKKN